MPVFKCPKDGCTYETEDLEGSQAIVFLTIHAGDHQNQPVTPPIEAKATAAERVKRPTLEAGVTLEHWTYFVARWSRYKKLSTIEPDNLTAHLLECCTEDLMLDLHRNNGANLDTMAEDDLLAEIKALAVRGESQIISRVNLRNMCQDHQEDIRHFTARVKGQATLCNYSIECPRCKTPVSYADEEIKDQLCAGLADSEIQKDVLAQLKQHATIEKLVTFVEDREAGKRSQTALNTQASSVSKISQYRKSKVRIPEDTSQDTVKSSAADVCSYCGETGHGRRSTRLVRKQQCPAFSNTCERCKIQGHISKMCRYKFDKKLNSIESQTGFLNSIGIATVNNKKTIKMSHREYTEIDGWVTNKDNKHPLITVGIEVSEVDFMNFGYQLSTKPLHSVSRIAIADTGAMTMVAGKELVAGLGLTISDLIPVSIELSAANNSKLRILGGMFITVWGRATSGEKLATRQLCYIQDTDNKVYLSRSACENLGLISNRFPLIGDCLPSKTAKTGEVLSSYCDQSSEANKCNCPVRDKPPQVPTELPYPAIPENLKKLKDWILDRYSASTFNVCENQKLINMSGEPLRIDVDPSVTPTAVHTPIPVPVHWKKEVKAQLDRDVKLGVIEPVPWGEPTTWCSRMVTVSKDNGSPRRTVDLQAVNNASVRQTHHTPSPFHQSMSVPHNTKKCVLDAWNGFHSLGIREQDRHYTTFITPWGRYRYCCAPQGFLASGDAYTRRFDEIIAHFKNKTKCIDDTLLWEEDIEKSFFQVCEFLTLCGENGITLNPSKFQFAEDIVEFAGFKITPTNVQPSDKYLDAVCNFPTPTDITGMRSWFGLVNQSAYAFSMTEIMAPFRDALKPGNKFYWDDNLQRLFDKSKQEIVSAVKNGVQLFDKNKKTALITDWSRTGTGFSLMQKHCTCNSDTPTCCREGWKLVFAGSQFNNKAESKYAPIEGECLAVVKALHKPTVRYFIIGCDDLIICTDHKPLVKLLGNRKLEDIDNPRLLSMKEKTLPYRFKMRYIAGKSNKVPDATSRFPTSIAEASDNNSDVERIVFSTAISALSSLEGIKSVTWENIQHATFSDQTMLTLLNNIQEGFTDRQSLPSNLKQYEKLKRFLTTVDGVILYKKRIVVPPQLRADILESLHSAHQGVSSMMSRAQASVFWPGITADIHKVRDRCSHCNRIAPSQPSAPPTPPLVPEYPFQYVCADYFTVSSNDYLVIVDRYSNWPSISRAGSGTANSRGLIAEIKRHCETFGIPEELSSDGGPQFTSSETRNFMECYGIRSRVSSVAYPHSNCRAEIGVKTMKRLIADNTGPGGSLNTDKVLRALLQYRNTPDPDTGLSPAEVVFGRQIRDFTPVLPGKYRPRDEWQRTLQKREEALSKRHFRDHERWSEHTQNLPPLKVGDHVYIQNQAGNHARRWDKSGVIVEVKQHHQYLVKNDGSGRATLRNRRFLRRFTPFKTSIKSPTPSTAHPIPSKHESASEDNDDYITIPQSPATPSNLCRGQTLPPVLTPNEAVSSPPVPSVAKPTMTTQEVPVSTSGDAYHSPVRHKQNTSLPHVRLDLGGPTENPETVVHTRSGRVSKPVDRYSGYE